MHTDSTSAIDREAPVDNFTHARHGGPLTGRVLVTATLPAGSETPLLRAGHEVVRQQRRRLTLIKMTPDLLYDQLIGMGCAERLVFSWGGNPGVGSLHRLRDAVENGWPQLGRRVGKSA